MEQVGDAVVKGRPILLEYQGEPRSLSEIGRLIGVAARTMVSRYDAGKRGEALFAPPDERMRRRGNWDADAVLSRPE